MFSRGKRSKNARTGHLKRKGGKKSSAKKTEGTGRSRGGSFLESLFDKSKNRRKKQNNEEKFDLSLSKIELIPKNKTSEADYLINQDIEEDDYRGSFMACLRGTELAAPPSLENRGDRFGSGLSDDSLGMVLSTDKKPVKFNRNPKMIERSSDLDKLECQKDLAPPTMAKPTNPATLSMTEIGKAEVSNDSSSLVERSSDRKQEELSLNLKSL